jgi:hypothetical protein
MREYEFSIIVSGADPADEHFEDRFFDAGCDDATLMLFQGAVAVCFIREADDFVRAILSACRDIARAGATIERLEPDFLVSQAEIAARANLTRSAISNYVSGARGSDFPRPHARVTTASPLWDWVDVASWLYRQDAVSLEAVIEARVTRAMNLALESGSSARPSLGRLEAILVHAVRISGSSALPKSPPQRPPSSRP